MNYCFWCAKDFSGSSWDDCPNCRHNRRFVHLRIKTARKNSHGSFGDKLDIWGRSRLPFLARYFRRKGGILDVRHKFVTCSDDKHFDPKTKHCAMCNIYVDSPGDLNWVVRIDFDNPKFAKWVVDNFGKKDLTDASGGMTKADLIDYLGSVGLV